MKTCKRLHSHIERTNIYRYGNCLQTIFKPLFLNCDVCTIDGIKVAAYQPCCIQHSYWQVLSVGITFILHLVRVTDISGIYCCCIVVLITLLFGRLVLLPGNSVSTLFAW
jgi:hypothetical protein